MKTSSISLPLVQCCVCKKIEDNGKWSIPSQKLLATIEQNISHSYCDECFKDLYHKLNLKNHNSQN